MKMLLRKRQAHGSTTYAQCGEDVVAEYLLKRLLNISSPTYLDIGAHHPVHLSNTYLFYKQGCRGVCVEPDPRLCRAFRSQRRGDLCLNCGVGTTRQDGADFYVMHPSTLSTFSLEEAQRNSGQGGFRIDKVIRIPLVTLNDLMREHFPSPPDFVSFDIEGRGLEILQTLDFSKHRPAVFCIETLEYRDGSEACKLTGINDLMAANGYLVYADTYINTVFVDRQAWESR